MIDAHPIQFCIPDSLIRTDAALPKRLDFSPLIPGRASTYQYDDEGSYLRHYGESYFAVTMRKSGWDCLRHYEILAAGCVPYFLDLQQCPPQTMFRLPRKLLEAAKRIPGVPAEGTLRHIVASGRGVPRLDWDTFDLLAYGQIRNELLAYTRERLTTTSMARYFLETACPGREPREVLLVSKVKRPFIVDYQRDLLFHGLHGLPDVNVHSVPDLKWMFADFPVRRVRRMWGKGFSVTRKLQRTRPPLSRWQIRRRLVRGEFDLVVFCTYSNHADFSDWTRMMSRYDRRKVVLLDGNDIEGDHTVPRFAGRVFRRELDAA